ncbi:hydroxymethylbilane synthase [Nocardiopsis sp. FR26]|uniref:hydroxymethylbilane synthase n=1 Tax=Nocardiopsis sp. FR26 TaxID=2605987 RepID=UPI00135CBDC8|nr:hydroxymethylbilane synthase [Nocardiopsis sp. FR26]
MSTLVPTTHTRTALAPTAAAAAEYFTEVFADRPALRLGTRSSPMALAQAHLVRDLLQEAGVQVRIVPIETSGDRWAGDLAELGGKGQFMKEIDRHLLLGAVDFAVHAVKDIPGDVPLSKGTTLVAYLPREEVEDVLVVREGSAYTRLEEMPPGTRIGTSAVRRKAQLLKYRPDLHVDRIRGLVGHRIARLDSEKRWEALVLNMAGLRRIRMEHRAVQVIRPEVMCPAVGSGVIGIQCKTGDTDLVELLRLLDDADTRTWVSAERTMLHGLQGRCNSPIAGHATFTADGQLSLRGMVFSREGGTFVYSQEWDRPENAAELGAWVAANLLRKGARGIIAGNPQ